MSTLGDALAAIKSIILIEERVRQQSEKVEKLANLVVDLDRRLVRLEAMLELSLRMRGAAGNDAERDPARLPDETSRRRR